MAVDLLVTLLWLGQKKTLQFRQSNGNNSFITDDKLTKLHMHNHTIIIYIQYNFHASPCIGYLVMAEDG